MQLTGEIILTPKNMAALSPSEAYLWHYIQDHKQLVMNCSITQLSEKANVSTATIVRTMKKAGYSGYTDFRYNESNQKDSKAHYAILNHVDEQIRNVIIQNDVEMTNTLNNLKISVLEDTIQLLYKANSIYLFAKGLSETVAEEMELKFRLLSKDAEFFHDSNIMEQLSKTLISNQDIVVFITLNGETPELVKTAKILSERDIPKVTLTCNANASIVKYTDELLLGYCTSTNLFNQFEVSSRLPLQIMSRILLDTYVVRTQEQK